MEPAPRNVFADIPAVLPEELFETLLQTGLCRLERIVSCGHATPSDQWYDQDWDEWVMVLQGQAGLRLANEDTARILAPGDSAWLPMHCRHRVEWTSTDPPTVWLALHIHTDTAAPHG
ncbi:MAG TPA: cupin domain-containing protein [Candidatus Competibacteraceae bacterium]|nr:cupin domain-containing protein [Candidatus Competibacteraceae bacterium]HQD55907.1 cupin domain-containing protein [Candidatus Competibacteraceae bacterium]